MFAITRHRCVGRRAHSLCRPTTTARKLHITQSVRSSGATTAGAATTSKNGSDAKKQRPGGSYTRILATFALGIPLGWAVKSLYATENDALQSAKPTDFVRYTLTKREPVSSTSSIFALKPVQGPGIDTTQLYDPRAITSVQFKQPQLQIARSYTVLPPMDGQAPDELRFLIRKEQKGEVSGYLHRLGVGATIEMRGPSVEYGLPESVTEVLFLAGGTGIAPAMQIASTTAREVHTHILWANRMREDCIGGSSDVPAASTASWSIFSWWSSRSVKSTRTTDSAPTITDDRMHPVVTQLEAMKSRLGSTPESALLVDYYVDEEGTFIRPADVARALHSNTAKQHGTRLLFVSGPEGFVHYWAGPKQWVGGREVQGPLGGALADLDLRGWQIVKL